MRNTIVGIGLAMLCFAGDARAEDVQTHSFNSGQIVLTEVDILGPNATVVTVTNNGGLPPENNLRQFNDSYADELTEPYTFYTPDFKYVIWKTTDQYGDPHWWLACWRETWFSGYQLQWSTEITHD